MLPNFLHAGAPKCASSWLWRVCKEHPDIYVPATPDNVNFFTVSYHQGLDWYEQTYFAEYAGQSAVGEFSNSTYMVEVALQRLAQALPDIRLTVMLRNPVERAYLHWAHLHLKKRPNGRNKYGFDPANGVQIPLERVLHHHGHQWWRVFIEPGLWAHHLKRMYRYVPPERVFVGIYDDLAADNAGFARRYFDFLGVEPDVPLSLIDNETNPDARRMDDPDGLDPELRARIAPLFAEDLAELSEMLDRDFSHWR